MTQEALVRRKARRATATSAAPPRIAPFVAGTMTAILVQCLFYAAVRRRVGPERGSLADALTMGRGLCGAFLAGLLVAGLRDRAGRAGRYAFVATLVGTTASDWLDGPLARRWGPTRLGAALDIEADSWLTLWAAAAAVRWGGLPPWCLVAPLLHYAHPARALWGGHVPSGGGPWWGRVTGVAQMALILTALSPCRPRPRHHTLRALATVVSAGQSVAQLALLWRWETR